MKINLVADYDIGGKKYAAAHSIDSSQNLVALQELTTLLFPTPDGAKWVQPTFLRAIATQKRAKEIAEAWNELYKGDGRLHDFRMSPATESEVQHG